IAQPITTRVEVDVLAAAREIADLLGLRPPGDGPAVFRPLPVRLGGHTVRLLVTTLRPVLDRRARLATMSVTEAMTVYFEVTLVCGIVLASPWVFFQIWSFVAAGLYPREKRYVLRYLPFSVGLFLAGVLVCQFLVIAK